MGKLRLPRCQQIAHFPSSARKQQSKTENPGHSRALTLLPATRSFTSHSPQLQPPARYTHTHTHTHTHTLPTGCPAAGQHLSALGVRWGDHPLASQAHNVCSALTACSLQTETPTYRKEVRLGAPAACRELSWRLHQFSQW